MSHFKSNRQTSVAQRCGRGSPRLPAAISAQSARRRIGPSLLTLMLILATLLTTVATAQQLNRERKVALVIGNCAYGSQNITALANPPRDARSVARTLTDIGFDVTSVVNGSIDEMDDAILDFGNMADRADVALFYYAGHGVQANGQNYLLPVDAELEHVRRLRREAVTSQYVLDLINDAAPRLSMVFLDACRNNPFTEGANRSIDRGLDPPSTRPSETMIVYATAAGDTADDGEGSNSPFTTAFLKHIATPGLDVYDLYRNISGEVQSMTRGDQRPELFGNVTARYSLVPDVEFAQGESRPSGGRSGPVGSGDGSGGSGTAQSGTGTDGAAGPQGSDTEGTTDQVASGPRFGNRPVQQNNRRDRSSRSPRATSRFG